MFLCSFDQINCEDLEKCSPNLSSSPKIQWMIPRSLYWSIFFLVIIRIAWSEQASKLPNFLICVSESHTAHLFGSLSRYGSELNPTPSLSKIAQQGYFHELAYCTNANQRSSAFCLQTGKTKNFDLENYAKQDFLAQQLQLLGYETAFFGGWEWDASPNELGYSSWGTLDNNHIFYNPKVKTPQGNYILEGYSTDIITDLAIRWMEEDRDLEKPFFVVLSYQATQRPWIPPVRMVEKLNNEWFDTPGSFFTDFSNRTPSNKYQDMNIAQNLHEIHDLFLVRWLDENESKKTTSILEQNLESMNDEQLSAWKLSWKPQNEAFARESYDPESLSVWKFQRFFKNYLRCLLTIDENIGRIFDKLASKPIHETHFIYTSERGRFCGEFGWFGSQWMYEPSSRIPFIFTSLNGESSPPLDPNQIFLDTDAYALIKDLTQDGEPKHLKMAREQRTKRSGTNSLLFAHDRFPSEYRVTPHIGLLHGKFKIIHYYPFDEWEFYDLEKDPFEENNLYENHSQQGLITSYKEKLIQAAKLQYLDEYTFDYSENWKRQQRSPDQKSR